MIQEFRHLNNKRDLHLLEFLLSLLIIEQLAKKITNLLLKSLILIAKFSSQEKKLKEREIRELDNNNNNNSQIMTI